MRDAHPWSPGQRFVKRALDLVVAVAGLVIGLPVLVLAWLGARLSTGGSGVYPQTRIGRDGEPFTLYKLRTMLADARAGTVVTRADDPRITRFGRLLRRWKLDELPQLWNVLVGDMSLVGPRPDVPGYADRLTGEDRLLLRVRPGITGPATLKYRDEEALLAAQPDPEAFNDEVLFPDKVAVNLDYVRNYSLAMDLRCLLATLRSGG